MEDDEDEPLMTQCINVDEFKQMLDGTISPATFQSPDEKTTPAAKTASGSTTTSKTTRTRRIANALVSRRLARNRLAERGRRC